MIGDTRFTCASCSHSYTSKPVLHEGETLCACCYNETRAYGPTIDETWGIALEWDADGLECCTWLYVERSFESERLVFSSEAFAQLYIDEVVNAAGTCPFPYGALPHTTATILTPRQFT